MNVDDGGGVWTFADDTERRIFTKTIMQVAVQLAFKGQCRQAFEVYEKLLGCKITVMNSFGESDAALSPGSTASKPGHIRFAEIKIGDHAILGNDNCSASPFFAESERIPRSTKSA